MYTQEVEDKINNSTYTHNYEEQALAEEDDNTEKYQALFEASLTADAYDVADDVGAVVIYYKDSKLVAFYDYERYVGTIF